MNNSSPDDKTNSLRSLTRQTVANLAIKIASIPLALGVSAILARALSVENFGFYGFAFSLFTVCAMPMASALVSLTVRELQRALAIVSYERATGILCYSGSWIIAGTLAFLVFVELANFAPLADHFSTPVEALHENVWIYPLFLITVVSGGLLRGMGRTTLGILPDQVFRQLLFLFFLVIAVLFVGEAGDTNWAFRTQTKALAVAAAISLVLVATVARAEISPRAPQFDWTKWNRSIGAFLFLGFVQIANTQLPIIALGASGEASEVAFYRVSDVISGLSVLPLVVVNFSLGPAIAKLNAQHQRSDIQSGITNASKIIWILSIPALLILMLFPEPLLAILFGDPYSDASLILRVLCIGAAYSAIIGPVGLSLNMLGHERETLRSTQISLGANTVFMILLIPRFGAVGAAMSATAAKIVLNTLLFRCLYEREGYSTLPFLLKPKLELT